MRLDLFWLYGNPELSARSLRPFKYHRRVLQYVSDSNLILLGFAHSPNYRATVNQTERGPKAL